ncbi:DNA-binding transcriptional regulator, LysR family [Variovorax sp. NFACC28]|nr:DNA-binding transcriptional regulator, LysR family [Variovorax sp. NFACC28]SEG48493.1 DNA-binding transcriptional regulator, LysR family [Variovorax sp. NFACC29]SFC23616.1 DNA-binding transcriptional regulator, LysR family [Variovorax sp. NFACC26]SFG63503.1 DNA-binding transcriptional regulator, LysR family [Variovorax sp. NFACC27]
MALPTARDPAVELQHALLTRLKLRQLSLLQAIDRHRTLSRVAAEMQLSQPAITKALHEVEDIFGSTLFERSSRGLVPTAAGDAVLHYARRWLAELEATTRVLTSLEAGRSGRLRLGLTQQVPQQLMSAALTHLLDRSPRISVMVREGTTDELVAGLVARELDCAIGRSYDGDASGLVQEAIHEQEPCLVVGAKNVKRLSRGPLDWARLAQLDWILPPPNTPMRRTYNAIFVGAGVQPPLPILETTAIRSIETVLRQEPNAITIFARDVLAGMEPAGHWAALPYRLSWNLPPVSFFTLKELEAHPTVRSLRGAVVETARRMKRSAG